MRFHRIVAPLACLVLSGAAATSLVAQVSFHITVGPPPIPIYEQPVLPEDGYLWTPGYWAWGEDGYYWVPGTWVQAPEPGLLWTPGYWAWQDDFFEFHPGYWGIHVGYYGGINYGHGYGGNGYEGGYWQGRNYYYNRAASNVNLTRVSYVYNKTVIVNNTYIAYNGGAGGLRTAPSPQERVVEREHHVQPSTEQTQHHQVASQNRELLASVNRGKPPVAATIRPADFSPKGVVPAKAPGGKVEDSTLKATPKTMERPPKGHGPEARPVSPNPPPGPSSVPAPRSEGRPSPAPTPVEPRPSPAPVPVPGRRPEPAPAPPPERRPEPAPAPRPERRPQPVPAPLPERHPKPAPAPLPERRPQPAPAPLPERHPQPAPAPLPERRPEPAPHPAPERHPEPAPPPEEKRRPKPPPHEGPEPKQRPDTPLE